MSIKRLSGAGLTTPKSNKVWDQTTFQSGMSALATVVIPSGGTTGTTGVTFSNIPQNYQHLEIRATILASAANEDILIRLGNGGTDTGSNYSWHEIRSDGSSVSARGTASTAFMYGGANAGDSTYPYTLIFSVTDYTSATNNKTIRTFSGQDRNGSGGVSIFTGNWRPTGSKNVDTVTVYMPSGTINQFSRFSLYGIKGA